MVSKEFGAFSGGLDVFSETHVIAARYEKEPISWWANYGASTPHLESCAFKVLSQVASYSCCECNWRLYENIQTVKRNRLITTRAKDLVKVHNNLRLLGKKTATNAVHLILGHRR